MDISPDAQNNDSRPQILVVDDDPIGRFAVGEELRSKDYSVTEAVDCHEAIEAMAAHAFDVLVCNPHLPGLSGVEVLTEIRDRFPKTAVIVLIGHADPDSASVRGFAENKGIVVLEKPIETAMLIGMVTALCPQTGADCDNLDGAVLTGGRDA